jgi:hypothetical protein
MICDVAPAITPGLALIVKAFDTELTTPVEDLTSTL